MSERSRDYRARATNVIKRFGQSNDPYIRELSLSIARSYQSIARSEEWLAGEITPEDYLRMCSIDPECRRLSV